MMAEKQNAKTTAIAHTHTNAGGVEDGENSTSSFFFSLSEHTKLLQHARNCGQNMASFGNNELFRTIENGDDSNDTYISSGSCRTDTYNHILAGEKKEKKKKSTRPHE